MELLAQSAKEIGSVMEQNLGKPTEIYVDEQKSETLWQDGQQDQDHSGRESEQYRQKEEQEKMQKAENTRFLQELRLGHYNINHSACRKGEKIWQSAA